VQGGSKKKLRIPLKVEDALRGAMQVPPPAEAKPKKTAKPKNVFRKWLFRAAPVRKRGVFREQPLPHGRGSVREQPSETRSKPRKKK